MYIYMPIAAANERREGSRKNRQRKKLIEARIKEYKSSILIKFAPEARSRPNPIVTEKHDRRKNNNITTYLNI